MSKCVRGLVLVAIAIHQQVPPTLLLPATPRTPRLLPAASMMASWSAIHLWLYLIQRSLQADRDQADEQGRLGHVQHQREGDDSRTHRTPESSDCQMYRMADTSFQNPFDTLTDEDESEADLQTTDELSNAVGSTSDLLMYSLCYQEPYHHDSNMNLLPASSLYEMHAMMRSIPPPNPPPRPPVPPPNSPPMPPPQPPQPPPPTVFAGPHPYMFNGSLLLPTVNGNDMLMRAPIKDYPASFGDEELFALYSCGLPPMTPLFHPAVGVMAAASTTSHQSTPGLPMFFSETSFQLLSSSSSPSDAHLHPSSTSIGLSTCPSAVLFPVHHFPPLLPPPLSRPNAVPSSGAPFPVVYVSPAGLLTVLLRGDVAVEMTLDRSVRVVNHPHRAVIATNSRDNASCVYHVAAKICQDRTTTELSIYGDRQARLTTSQSSFSWSPSASYTVTSASLSIQTTPTFSDLSKDVSVTLHFSSSGYGPHLMTQYDEVAQAFRYRYHRNGAVTVVINGVRIHQTPASDVIVTSGRKYLRDSPLTGLARVVTHFVEMTVEESWTVRLRRGGHRMLATPTLFILANAQIEFGFDEFRRLFLQPVSVRNVTIIYKGKSLLTTDWTADLGHCSRPWPGSGGLWNAEKWPATRGFDMNSPLPRYN